ncbi:MAG: hypothetical protein ACKVOJ_11460 [Sphingomonadaceae bacterium]
MRRRTAIVALLLSCGLVGGGALYVRALRHPVYPPAHVNPQRTSIGINLATLQYWGNDRALANLVASGIWKLQEPGYNGAWRSLEPSELNADATLRSLAPGYRAHIFLNRPAAPFAKMRIKCTYSGSGTFDADGFVKVLSRAKQSFEAELRWSPDMTSRGWITVSDMPASNPIKNLDCREVTLPRRATFAPEFLAYIKMFSAVRFLDWQPINANPARVSWATVSNPNLSSHIGPDGASVPMMVALANEAEVDPWFLMPYNADDTYIRGFATYVHDHLKLGLVAHVELGNEVWNYGFGATTQAQTEGLAAGLSNDGFRALLLRYAQKSNHAMAIWESVFAAEPKRLKRIIATQAVCDWCFAHIMEFEDTKAHVDAFAVAAYMGAELNKYSPATIDQLFADLNVSAEAVVNRSAKQRAIAAHYGKELLGYEGGQHVVGSDLAFARQVQADPRMGMLYTRFLTLWQQRVGERMMLFNSTSGIGDVGAWGLREYAGQAYADAPKLAAVRTFIAGLRSKRTPAAIQSNPKQ